MLTPLRDFLCGRTYVKAEIIFQDALDPVVKGAMQVAFPTDPKDASDPYVIALAERQQALADRLAKAADLREKLNESPDQSMVRLLIF